jgi:aryl-alcohol dehydrogenase-like predicted oxidoreductase
VQVIDDWFTARKLGLVFEARVGRGRLVVCSILLDDAGVVARQLRRSLLHYIAGDRFQPLQELDLAAIKDCLRHRGERRDPQVGISVGSGWTTGFRTTARKPEMSIGRITIVIWTRLHILYFKGEAMDTKRLGNSDMHLTPLGIGAWAMGGGGWQFAWGPQDDNASIAAIRAGLSTGINWIDTAAIYGHGHSEEIVARALEGISPRPYVFTKCERNWNERREIFSSLKRDDLRKECENSLRRLRMEAIDLYQIHWPDPEPDIEEGWETLARLKEEGKVRWIGVSNFNVDQMERIRRIAPITSLQPPYSIVSPEIEQEILPYCARNKIGVIVYSPMKSGLLSGKMTRERIAAMPADDHRPRTPHFREPKLTRNLALVEVLREIGKRHGRAPGEVAIAWTLRRPEVTAAITGLRSPDQVNGIIGAADFRMSSSEIAEIVDFLAAHPA